jgi:hypothetical protein
LADGTSVKSSLVRVWRILYLRCDELPASAAVVRRALQILVRDLKDL